MTVRCFVGGERAEGIPATDRGLAYGDGLFETMRAHAGNVPWWDAHWTRLQHGARRLSLSLPDRGQVLRASTELLAGEDAVLKLIVTRGQGGRGYAPPPDAVPNWILSRHPLPEVPTGGLVLRWCDTRLATQPLLAGIKHCNRLEQVLARTEWCNAAALDRDADEGLMRSVDGDVVCATSANLFVLREGRWCTPAIERCGVAGICRQWLLDEVDVHVTALEVADIERADAVFLCNAVRGILGVARLGACQWPMHEQVGRLQRRLAAVHPGFSNPSTMEMP